MARGIWLFPLLVAACAPRPSAAPISVTDDWGRRVALAAPARRIVSLSPATTELLFAMGLGSRVVGRTRFDDWPPAALAVPDIGNGLAPSVESVVARQPDLVLLYSSEANRTAADQLSALGVPTAVLQLDRTADLLRTARALGVLAGARAAADSVVAAFAASLASVARRDSAAFKRRPRVFVDVWPSPPMTVGRGSYLDEIVRAAGADNAFDDLTGSSATVSFEAIVARDPDAVIVLAADTARPDLAQQPGWRAVRAVREHRVVVVDQDLYGRPSPRTPLAAADLARRLAALFRPPRAR